MKKAYLEKQRERQSKAQAVALIMVKVAAEHGLTVQETLNAADYVKILAQDTIVTAPESSAD